MEQLADTITDQTTNQTTNQTANLRTGRDANQGHGSQLSTPPPPAHKLMRSSDGPLSGVAGGLANYVGVDPTIVRVGLVAGTFFYGIVPLLYIAAWLIVPRVDATPPPPAYA